jgi:multisubunit Na+/H+ antiporter MnhC subunit
MVLTGIVVAVAATALALTLARRWSVLSGRDDISFDRDGKRGQHD